MFEDHTCTSSLHPLCILPRAHGRVCRYPCDGNALTGYYPCYCWTRAASLRKIWWQHLALSTRVSWFPSMRLVAGWWLSLDSQAKHHLFRDCCDANKGGHWGCAVGITRGVEAEMLRRCCSLVRTSSTSSLLFLDVVMEDAAWCPSHQRLTMRQCPFVWFLNSQESFSVICPSWWIVLGKKWTFRNKLSFKHIECICE